MKLRFMALLLLVVTCAVQAQQAAPVPQQAGNAAANTQTAPGVNATNEEIADFFVRCASANADSAYGSEVLTGKVGTAQMNAANYYIALAETYSVSDRVKKEQEQLRNMAGTQAKGCTGGQVCALAVMVMLSAAQRQMVTCAGYVKANKDTLDARVAPLAASSSDPAKPN